MKLRDVFFGSVLLATLFVSGSACTDVPIDDERRDARLAPARGVIRGTVTYVGPRPCSRDGHIVGNAIVLVFDRRNPPPPQGIASSAVNFVAVPGDRLFANEPRSVSKELVCPPDDTTITVSVPFAIAPLDGGSYMVQAFYDRRGRFLPTFKFRNQPEAGDIAGGYVDLEDARKNASNPSYQPIFLPVDVGVRQASASDNNPVFTIGADGYVADNVPVTIGTKVPFARPYFYPEGADQIGGRENSDANITGDPFAVPIVAMTQDAHILAPPSAPTPETLDAYQSSFRSLKLVWGVPDEERDAALADPFGLQLSEVTPSGNGGLLVFSSGTSIPENPAVPSLWPQVALVKLADDPRRKNDPQSLVVQGTPEETNVTGEPVKPVVVLQGITLLDDSLAKTMVGPVPNAPTTAALRDHVTVLFRPAVLCFDPRNIQAGGLLVTPHLVGRSADASEQGDKPLFDESAVANQRLVREVRRGCLPKGRYAISLVQPSGQAWTVPNEIGGCAPSEGNVTATSSPASCSTKPRPVLLSQGARAVLEIVSAGPDGEETCSDNPVPDECLHL